MPPVMDAPPRDPEVALPQEVAELHLLIGEMGDELSAYRRREAAWLSIVVHVVIFLGLIFIPKWLPKGAVIVSVTDNKDITFMTDSSRSTPVKPPRTDVVSDANRIAQSRKPVLDKDLLRRLREMQRPGPPAPAPRPAPQQQQAMQQSPQQATPEQPSGAQNPVQSPQPQQQAQLQTPQPQAKGPVNFHTGGPGIEQAIQNAANRGATHYTFGGGGDYGPTRLQPNTNVRGDVEIMTDTMGVDFGPYLKKVLFEIKRHWYDLIPEVARPPIMKRGNLTVEFAINQDGSVAGLRYVRTSGDIALDRPAYGSITASDPFPRLPSDFKGNYIALRIRFYYNPDPRTDDLN
ncbi:MAG TPA: TonB C-terminal domain-containing protein [Candidatus Angelobacter sp.]